VYSAYVYSQASAVSNVHALESDVLSNFDHRTIKEGGHEAGHGFPTDHHHEAKAGDLKNTRTRLLSTDKKLAFGTLFTYVQGWYCGS
jgi:hypothetical protein